MSRTAYLCVDVRAVTFRSAIFRKVREELILDTSREGRVRFLLAEACERQHRNALIGGGSSRCRM